MNFSFHLFFSKSSERKRKQKAVLQKILKNHIVVFQFCFLSNYYQAAINFVDVQF